jgi:hypothetical protein
MRTALLCVALLAGCAGQHPATRLPGAALLGHIPADTPYLLAALEPPPRAELEHELAQQGELFHKSAELLRQGPVARGPAGRVLLALLDELEPNFSVEGLDRLGLGAGMTMAFYSLGFLPALRAEVRDPRLVAELIERVMTRSGGPAPIDDRHGRRWEVKLAGGVAILGVSGSQLVAGITPHAELARFLGRLYGDEPIGPTLAESGRLAELLAGYHLLPRFVGWLDFAAALHQALDERSLAAADLRAFEVDPGQMPPACRVELDGLVTHAPRLVMGAEEMSPTRQRAMFFLELDGELARELSPLRTPAVGVGSPLGQAVMSFGVAADVPRFLDVVRGRVRRVLAAPFTCAALLGLNQTAAELDDQLGKPLPPWLVDLRGIALEVLSVEVGGLGPKVRGVGVLSAADPIRLYDLAKRYLPQLPNVTLPPDGRPVKLPGGLLFLDAYLAMRGQLLGGALGDGADVELARLMSERPGPDAPLLAFAFDSEKLTHIIVELGKLGGGKNPPPPMPVKGRISVRLFVEEHGLAARLTREEQAR